MNEDTFMFNKKLVQTINMFWLKRGIRAGARLKNIYYQMETYIIL